MSFKLNITLQVDILGETYCTYVPLWFIMAIGKAAHEGIEIAEYAYHLHIEKVAASVKFHGCGSVFT